MKAFPDKEPIRPFRWKPFLAGTLPFGFGLILWAALSSRGDQKTLGFFAPLIEFLMDIGKSILEFFLEHSIRIGYIFLGTLCLFGLVFLIWRRLRALPLTLVFLAIGTGTLAQCFLVANRLREGLFGYALSFFLSFFAAVWPLRIDKEEEGLNTGESSRKIPWIEVGFLVFLTLISLLFHLYSLTFIPDRFDDEMIGTLLQSTSLRGVRLFMTDGTFVGNSVGAFHILLMWVLFNIFGTTLFAVRLAAALPGALTVPIFYLFLRSLKDRSTAALGAVILAFTPLHLFISRADFNFFAFVPLLGILMAWLTLKAVETVKLRYYLILLLAMPASRFVYTAGHLAWLIPIAVYLHACIFKRGFFRKGWFMIPFLIAGGVLWYYSVSLVLWPLNGNYKFFHPIATYGASAWEKAGAGASRADQIRETTLLLRKNSLILVDGIFHQIRFPTHFFQSWKPIGRGGVYVPGAVAALIVPALGLLIGRIRNHKAFLLLVWIAVGLVPGLFSQEASERRVIMIFPAFYAGTAILLAVLLERSRTLGNRFFPCLQRIILCAGTVALSLVGLNALFRLPSAIPPRLTQARFVGDLMRESDLVIHDFEWRMGMGLDFFNSRYIWDSENPTASQYEIEAAWPMVALRPSFRGDSDTYRVTRMGERIRKKIEGRKPEKVTFVLRNIPQHTEKFHLLDELYPEARKSELWGLSAHELLLAYTIPGDAPEKLANVEVAAASGDISLVDDLLGGIPYVLTEPEEAYRIAIRGGMLVPTLSWYAFNWSPHCPSIQMTMNERPIDRGKFIPLTRGAHRFTLRLGNSGTCSGPLNVAWKHQRQDSFSPIPIESLVSPRAASLPLMRSEPSELYPGHGQPSRVMDNLSEVRDMTFREGVGLVVLRNPHGVWTVQALETGRQHPIEWRARDVGEQPDDMRIAVSDDGRVALVGVKETFFFNLVTGERLGHRKNPTLEPSWDGEFDPLGRLWVPYPTRHQIICWGDDSSDLFRFGSYGDAMDRFDRPNSVVFGPDHTLFVADAKARVQVFDVTFDPIGLKHRREFRVAFGSLPFRATHFGVDSNGWFFYPERETKTILVYDDQGRRRLAENPHRDLNGIGFDEVRIITCGGGYIYLFDLRGHTIWKVPE